MSSQLRRKTHAPYLHEYRLLEAGVTAVLGRERYQRDPDADPRYRNGHQPITVKTTSGALRLDRPKVRGTAQRFASQPLAPT